MARARKWFSVATSDSSISGAQQSTNLTATLRTILGVDDLKDFTVTRVLGTGVLLNETSETSAALAKFFAGIGVYTNLIDDGDFPSLENHTGDWLWYDARMVKGAGTGLTPVLPDSAATIPIDSKSMRKLRAGDDLFMVVDTPGGALDLTFAYGISVLMLYPE